MAYVAQTYLIWQGIEIAQFGVVPDAVDPAQVQTWLAAGQVVDDPTRANIEDPPVIFAPVAPPRPKPPLDDVPLDGV
jgi:uncharacterized membrane protein